MGQGHVTGPRSFFPGSSWQEKPKSVSLMFMSSSKRMFSGFRSRCTMLSLCKVKITSSRALMIFLGWDRNRLLSSATLQGQVTGRDTKAHKPAGLQVREDSRQARPTLAESRRKGGHQSQRSTLPTQTGACHASSKTTVPKQGTQAGSRERGKWTPPGFLLTQGDLLSEVIKELPSLHPVGTEGL